MISCVRGVAADVDAVGKLAGKSLRDPVAVDEFVLLEDKSENRRKINLTSKNLFWQRNVSDLNSEPKLHCVYHFQLKNFLALEMMKNCKK